MMLSLKKRLLKFLLSFCALCLFAPALWAQTAGVDIVNLKATRLNKDVAISADIKFDLPASIEEAMYKGVSLTFVSEIELTQERWYWIDKKVLNASRQTRISYQALTRRWRVLPWSDGATPSGLGVHLPQTYETLAEALSVAKRIYQWRIAPSADIEDGSYWVQLNYRLDISQLPKPLQIGLLGSGDWSINATTRQRIQMVSTP